MRHFSIRLLAAAGALVCIFLALRGQAPSVVVPFASTPFIAGMTTTVPQSVALLARKIDGSYVQLGFGSTPPFGLASTLSALTDLLSGGVSNLLAAPAGPANVGRASQAFALGVISPSGTPAVAFANPVGSSSVRLYVGSLSYAYTAQTDYPVGPSVSGVIMADFNNDGNLDMAVTYAGAGQQNSPPGGVGILINNGDGTFKAAVSYGAGGSPNSVAALDVNHDNKIDLVVADNTSSSLYVLLGNGDGTFASGVPYTAGSGVLSVTIADFNNDGNPDIAASADDSTVTILLGNGNGTFRAGSTVHTGKLPFAVAAADFNKDGKLDLVTINAQDQTATIFSGNGDGSFQQKSSYIISNFPGSVVIADYNNDGFPDILVGNGDARLIGADFDSGNIDILVGNGDGTFRGASITKSGGSAGGTTGLAVADFNGDGVPDAVVNGSFQGSLYLLPGTASGVFQPATKINLATGSQPSALAAGDFNGDGKIDLAVADKGNGGTVAILLNSSSGFQAPSTFGSGGTAPSAIVTADFDGDGKLDLAVANSMSGNVAVFRGGGNGAFQLLHTFQTGTSPQSIAVADLNGDGLPDLVVADNGQPFATPVVLGAYYVLLNLGGGNFSAPVPYAAADGPIGVTLGDVNHDGIPDMIGTATGANFTYNLDVFLGNGNGTFGPVSSTLTEFGPTAPLVGDFNGDGKTDIVIPHCCGATDMTFLQGNGNGTFQPEVEFNGGPSPYVALAADLNGDGSPDLVVAGNDGGVVGLLNITASTNFPCQLSTTLLQTGASGGSFDVTINTGSCTLGVTGLPSWITVASTSARGVTLAVAANTGGARSASIMIGNVALTVNQAAPPACTYSLNAGGEAFSAAGGSGAVNISVNPGCPWSASGPPSWITFTSSATGSGPGTLTFQAAANSGGARSGTFTVAGVSFSVQQQASSVAGLNFIGSMPHIAAEENWITTFTLVNKGSAPAVSRLSFFGDASDPSGNGPLLLPLLFPQQGSTSGPLLAPSFDQTVNANASLIVSTAGPQTPPVLVGSAQLAATGSLDGFAIFHLIPGSQEAVVPMETRNASSYLLAYDNTGGVVLGVAVENVSSQSGTIGVVIRDDTGAQIGTGTLAMSGNGHTSFVLSTQYPATAGKRGTIQFNTPPGGQISVLGIRTTPLGTSNTLTTIPALANVGTGGGSIAHIAAANGWQTTFVLVNTGASTSHAHLAFFDDGGNALPLSLTFPQTSATSTASFVDQNLAAGATLLVQASGALADPVVIGSAQLTTSGNVGGFVIFRYNPNGQEAVVPLESRNAGAYILAFDNTGGTATGIAVNDVASQAVNIPVVVRDDTGAQIATDTLNLAANGHLSFTLAVDKYPGTANLRGTIEFDAPAGAQIGALGIRIPIAHTFTTLPALAK